MLKSDINNPDPSTPLYSWIEQEIKSLREDNSTTICPADKGNATVIMNTVDYNTKVMKLLNDDDVYKKIPYDPTKTLEKDIWSKLRNLKKMNRISDDLYKSLIPKSSKLPKFYGLPKIHKTDIPLRPIVDFRHSPAYKLSAFLSKLLKPLAERSSIKIKNSYTFSDEIRDFQIPPDHCLVSFDVVSLFTKVPVINTITYINTRLENDPSWKRTYSLTSRDVTELLLLCVQCTYFRWEDLIFQQTEGTPMGSPLSPVFAELFLQQLEENTVSNNPDIRFYRRFVDDAFACVKTDSLSESLSKMNKYHTSIQFTVEVEKEGKLPFLDLLLIREDNDTIRKKVYRKPTNTSRYLNFESYHHISQKISLVDSLLYRALIICDSEFIEEEINFIEMILTKNKYPIDFIRKRIS
jgi:hypothetical protein